MVDNAFSATKATAIVLWVVAVVALILTAVCIGTGRQGVALFSGFFSCATSTVAAVVTVRLYVLRVCGLIRTVSGLEDGSRLAELRSLR